MKRLFPLTFVAMLLCGCPDAKLPKPTPMVPKPKAAATTLYSPSGSALKTQNADQTHVSDVSGRA